MYICRATGSMMENERITRINEEQQRNNEEIVPFVVRGNHSKINDQSINNQIDKEEKKNIILTRICSSS